MFLGLAKKRNGKPDLVQAGLGIPPVKGRKCKRCRGGGAKRCETRWAKLETRHLSTGPSEEATSPVWGLSAFESVFFSHPPTVCEKMKSADSKTSPFPSIVAKRTSKNTYPFHISSVKITA